MKCIFGEKRTFGTERIVVWAVGWIYCDSFWCGNGRHSGVQSMSFWWSISTKQQDRADDFWWSLFNEFRLFANRGGIACFYQKVNYMSVYTVFDGASNTSFRFWIGELLLEICRFRKNWFPSTDHLRRFWLSNDSTIEKFVTWAYIQFSMVHPTLVSDFE